MSPCFWGSKLNKSSLELDTEQCFWKHFIISLSTGECGVCRRDLCVFSNFRCCCPEVRNKHIEKCSLYLQFPIHPWRNIESVQKLNFLLWRFGNFFVAKLKCMLQEQTGPKPKRCPKKTACSVSPYSVGWEGATWEHKRSTSKLTVNLFLLV